MDQTNILTSIQDGIIVVDNDGRIVFVNQGYERIFHVHSDKVVGRLLLDIEPDSPILTVLTEDMPLFDILTRVMSTGIDIVNTVTLIKENGLKVGAIAVFKDATEMVALQDMAHRYRSELQELRIRLLQTDDFISDSPQMQKVLALAKRVALVDSTVLIEGESGVGKELVAKLIHHGSSRHDGPFVIVNCGAIPENLMEAAVFGYEKGAFTGADPKGKVGLVEVAEGGTLFLDEVGELPLALQVKLLRVVQEKKFLRVGGVKPISVNVRFLSATNRKLAEMVKARLFRDDLYYRLNVVSIQIPPLRERKEDILKLLQRFLDRFNVRYNCKKNILPDVLLFMEQSYAWPGNIRELENLIERIVVASCNDSIGLDDEVLRDYFSLHTGDRRSVVVNETIPLQEGREILERELIRRALKYGGSGRSAAKILGVDQSTIARKAKKYGIDRKEL